MDDYLNTLKKLNFGPKKVKVKENKEEMLIEIDVSMSDIVLEQIMAEQPTNGEMDLRAEIVKWFLKNPYPSNADVDKFSKKLGAKPEDFKKQIYSIISSILSEGKSKGKDIEPNPHELEMGIKVEMEHTSCPIVSRKIAMDHLVEIGDYYTRLDKMENEAGVKDHD